VFPSIGLTKYISSTTAKASLLVVTYYARSWFESFLLLRQDTISDPNGQRTCIDALCANRLRNSLRSPLVAAGTRKPCKRNSRPSTIYHECGLEVPTIPVRVRRWCMDLMYKQRLLTSMPSMAATTHFKTNALRMMQKIRRFGRPLSTPAMAEPKMPRICGCCGGGRELKVCR